MCRSLLILAVPSDLASRSGDGSGSSFGGVVHVDTLTVPWIAAVAFTWSATVSRLNAVLLPPWVYSPHIKAWPELTDVVFSAPCGCRSCWLGILVRLEQFGEDRERRPHESEFRGICD